jgi:hypothetical protein
MRNGEDDERGDCRVCAISHAAAARVPRGKSSQGAHFAHARFLAVSIRKPLHELSRADLPSASAR